MKSNDITALLQDMDKRLSKIEQKLGLATVPVQNVPSAAANKAGTQPALNSAAKTISGNWLGIVAVICFVLAAGFIIKLSIDSGWLTPVRQLAIATCFGAGLIATGLALLRSDHSYASYLPGAGVIVLYLTVFASHRIYDLISFPAAIALVAVVSLVCLWLHLKIRHDIYPLTAAVGAYVAPVLMGVHASPVFTLYYFLVCSTAFAMISIWMESRILILVSSYLAVMMSALTGLPMDNDKLLASLLALHFIIFAIGTLVYTSQNRTPLKQGEAMAFLPVLLLFYAVEYDLVAAIQPNWAPWISMGFAALLIGLYLTAKKYFPERLASQTIILAYATIVGVHSVYIELLSEAARSWLFVAVVLGAAAMSFSSTDRSRLEVFKIPLLALFLIVINEYFTMLYLLLIEQNDSWLAVSIAAVASLWILIVRNGNELKQHGYGYVLLGSAHLLAVTGLYRLAHDAGSVAISASWLGYAVAIIVFAYLRKDEIMARSALFVLAFAAGKALLYDAASAPTIVRILCLLLTGAVLYGSGLFLRKIDAWNKA